ncbi:radical SAM family heme chaperone HemW [Thauera sp. SDU_THAU2]|uniref:radical SAM family heme chaperone HemW n=1 Tax=Thauera sp. SDU_THAU2 TaxID=3136633 RepID=UPI00311DCF7B
MTRRIIPLTPAPAARTVPLPQRPQLDAPPPLALYVHFPWCVRKCPYCDFNSHTPRDNGIPEQAWLDAVLADLQHALPQVWGRRVHSIFIGGGTPSLMSARALDALLTNVRMLLQLDPLAEITLEANPGTVEAERFRDYRAAGVNRISLGIQSFDDAMLTRIGRIHGGDEAKRAIEAAATYFERVNLDLMYALPGQTLEQALADLNTALGFGTEHLSCYHLTLEPNTPFAHDPPSLPDDDSAADMQEAIETRLAAAGFAHYETSAFARPHGQSRHNLNYWTFGDYLGIGPGAHGKLSSHEGIRREMRHKHPARYLEGAARGDFVQEAREVAVAELPFEFMMNALRLTDGVPAKLFAARTGIPLEAIGGKLRSAQEQGLLETGSDRIRPSARGQRFLNDLLQVFLED